MGTPKRWRHRSLWESEGAGDPLEGMANLFDVGIVFAVALLLATLKLFHLSEVFQKKEVTWVKNPGRADMEIWIKKGKKLERYQVSRESLKGEGVRLGVCYQLKSGEVVYVPEEKP